MSKGKTLHTQHTQKNLLGKAVQVDKKAGIKILKVFKINFKVLKMNFIEF